MAGRIGGVEVDGLPGMEVRAPFDGRLLAEVPDGDAVTVGQAVAVAAGAVTAQPLPAWRRAEVLDAAAAILTEAAVTEELARCIALEAAKPIVAARGEVARAASTFAFAAAACRTLRGDMLPLDASAAGEGRLGFAMRVPVGVVGAITPFNFPLNLVVHKVAPAIAAGCPVVLKPAHQTPLTAIRLQQLLLDRCGLPSDWLNLVTGQGSTAGKALVEHDDVAMLTFTGSPEVGWGIRARAPRKRVALELGNNAPLIVHADGDWRTAAARAAEAGYSHAGQSCISVQRVFVHESIAAPFTEALAEAVAGLRVGDPLDEDTQVSALIDRANVDRVHGWVEQAQAEGATVVVGGDRSHDGRVLTPTLLTDVAPDMQVCRQEVFGPVVAVATYRDVAAALTEANRTRYGLHAGIYTQDLAVARQAIERLDFGGVLINDVPTWRADQMPYGGRRDSGNTREGPLHTLLEMTELRSVVIA